MDKPKKILHLGRWIFLLIQVGLTIYFITNAWIDWNATPIVTSIHERKLENEPFPAISICYANTWKWPGIIKAASNLPGQEDHVTFHKALVRYKDYFSWGGMIHFATSNQYLNTEGKIDHCEIFNLLFDNVFNDEFKDAIKWFLDYVQHFQEDEEKVKEFNDEIPAWWDLWKHLKINDTELFKTLICDLNLADCNEVSEENSCNLQLDPQYDKLAAFIHIFWALHRYQNGFFAAQILQYESYDFNRNSWLITQQRERLIEYLKTQSGSVSPNVDLYVLWHIFHHFYVTNEVEDSFAKMHGFANVHCFEDDCQDALEATDAIDDETKDKILNWMSQPKIHGDMHSDFVLIPQCSFGNDEQLTHCDLFKESEIQYQDHTCFTYDQPQPSAVGRNNGLNLILNLKSIPHDQPSTLKLFVHQPGTIPDVLNLVSGFEEIRENSWTNIGISINSYETTDNFNDMSFQKRKCTLDQSNRTQCLVNLVHHYAIQTCNCSPFPSSNGSLVCDLKGSYCFRNAIRYSKIHEDECPEECIGKEYPTSKSIDTWDNPFSFGQNFVEFLLDNPSGLIRKNETFGNEYGQRGYEGLVRTIWKDFSLVQIYFDQPLMTVITQDAKVTLSDMVSNFGGTIGIFLGLSALSTLDLCVNGVKILQRYFHQE